MCAAAAWHSRRHIHRCASILEETQFAALISALHRCAQNKLPLTVGGAGLPQLRGLAGKAKSYAERLFDCSMIGPLDDAEAEPAIVKPAKDAGINFAATNLAIDSVDEGYTVDLDVDVFR